MSRRVRFAPDNLLELVGAALLVWGTYVCVGRGIAIVVAAAAVLALAEFSWPGHTQWSLPLPRRPHMFKALVKVLRIRSLLVRHQLRTQNIPGTDSTEAPTTIWDRTRES